MEANSSFWGSTDFAYTCLIDKQRTTAFKKAIQESVNNGDIVVDAGSGTGILGLFALDAGAKHVYFIEIDGILAKTLSNTLSQCNYEESRYTVLSMDVLEVDLPEKVDVIICEMIATGLIDEFQIPALRHLRKYAKKDTRYVPSKMECLVDLVQDKNDFYEHKLQVVRYEYGGYDTQQGWSPVSLTEKKSYYSVDFTDLPDEDELNLKIDLQVLKEGTANGVRISSSSALGSTEFQHSLSYCMPIILPIADLELKPDNKVQIQLSYKLCGGLEQLKYKILGS